MHCVRLQRKAFIMDGVHVCNGKVLTFDHLTSSKFEEIHENGNEGCGFVPVGYFGLGNFAVKVRIIASKLVLVWIVSVMALVVTLW